MTLEIDDRVLGDSSAWLRLQEAHGPMPLGDEMQEAFP